MLIKEVNKVDVEGEERYQILFEYNRAFLDQMKRAIPFPDRKWDPDHKWTFTEKGLEKIRLFPGIIFYEDALKQVVDESLFQLPIPSGLDSSIDFSKFDREDGKLSLWDFQKIGISRIVNMKTQGLWFEMGLGKTYTTICAMKELLDRKQISQCLVISTVSMALRSWADTLDRLGYSYRVVNGPVKYRASILNLATEDFILALDSSCTEDSYPLYKSLEDLQNYKKIKTPRKKKSFVDIASEKNLGIVVDELHKLSNCQSKTFKSLLKIGKSSEYRVALTGTVLKSTPEKCLLPLRFLYPEVFNRKADFEEAFTVKEITRFGPKIVGYRNLDVLKSILHKAGMPALKKDYLKDLPALLPEKKIICDTDKVSIDLITEIRNESKIFQMKLSDVDYTLLQDVYIRVHQALVCPSFFIKGAQATNRLQAVVECLEALNGKTVIFTTLKRAIFELHAYLTERGFGCTCCSGDQPIAEINRRVDKFINNDECSVLIATIQKMGTGFDGLKIAQNAIIYDHNTNAADLRQAVDRLHRFGQKNAVSVIHILQDNSVSEYQFEKIQLQKKIMEDVESSNQAGIESAIDFRNILELTRDSSSFLRKKFRR